MEVNGTRDGWLAHGFSEGGPKQTVASRALDAHLVVVRLGQPREAPVRVA